MSRPIVQIYAAAVCFTSVSCLAIALGIAIYSAIGAVAPALTVHPMMLTGGPPEPQIAFPPLPDGAQSPVPPGFVRPALSTEETAKRKAEMLATALRTEEIISRQSLLRWGIVAIISAFLFAAHWRILRGRSVHAA